MKLCRFDENRVGIVRGDLVFDITKHAGDKLFPSTPIGLPKMPCKPLRSVKLLSPVRAPGKILAAPVNYKAHIAEMQKNNVSPGHNIWDIEQAGLFLKASSSVGGAGEGIAQRFLERRTDFAAELGPVIGEEAPGV